MPDLRRSAPRMGEPVRGIRGDLARPASVRGPQAPEEEGMLQVQRGRRHCAGSGQAHARWSLLGRIRGRGRREQVSRPDTCRKAGV
jgi:hypothetical protein